MSLSATRETVDAKAYRLISEARVSWAQGVAVIKGDHETHVVRRQDNTWSCTCPWAQHRPADKPCSHVLAAALTAPAAPPAPPVPPAPVVAAPAPVPQPAPASHTLTPMPKLPRPTRFERRYAAPVRVEDPAAIAALRRMASPGVRYVEQNGNVFAICDQTVLDAALSPWRS